MPRGLKRFQESKQTHFVTFSCYRRQGRLRPPARCDLFVEKLEQTRRRFGLRIYGFVVMPEHLHLLLSEPDRDRLATAIQSLKLAVAKSVPGLGAEAQEPTQFWQKRYYDRNVRDHDEFVEKLRYIHRNPVKRGLVQRPEEWPWSSFRHYATGEAGGVEIESEWTTRQRERAAPARFNPR
ncbi:MAG: REP-associated tyrosine transposase [Burkholderiales bacterium]